MISDENLLITGPDGLEVGEIFLHEIPATDTHKGFSRSCGVPTWCAIMSMFGTIEHRPALLKPHHIRWSGPARWTYLQLGRYKSGSPLPSIPDDVLEWALKDQRLVLVSLPVVGQVEGERGIWGTAVMVRVHAVFEYEGVWLQKLESHYLLPFEIKAAADALAGVPQPVVLIGDV